MALTADAFASMRNRGALVPPAAAAAAAASAAPLPSVRLPPADARLAVMPNFALDTSFIVGLSAVAEEDRMALTELLVLIITIKCPGTDYSSELYERPRWARIERAGEWYNIVVGGWADLSYEQLKRIYNSDVQVGIGRNLTSLRVANEQPNDDNNKLELSLIIRWISASGRRREIARNGTATTTEVEELAAEAAEAARPRVKKPLLKRVLDTWTDALWGDE